MVERFVELHTQMVWPVYLLDCVVLVAVYGWVKWALGDMRFVASHAFFKMGWFALLEIVPACAILGSGAVAQFIQHRRAESAKPAA